MVGEPVAASMKMCCLFLSGATKHSLINAGILGICAARSDSILVL